MRPQRSALNLVLGEDASHYCKELATLANMKEIEFLSRVFKTYFENFCLVLDSQKGVFYPPYSQTARSNCSVAKETTAKLGLLLVGLFCDMKKGGQKMQRESSHISHFLVAVSVFLCSSFCCLSR